MLLLYLAGGVAGNLAFLAEQYMKVQGGCYPPQHALPVACNRQSQGGRPCSVHSSDAWSWAHSPCGHPTNMLSTCAGKPRWAREYAYRASMPALGASGSVNACFIFNILAQPYATVLIYGKLHAGSSEVLSAMRVHGCSM